MSEATPIWRSVHVERPTPGMRIVAIYSDGSGARLFLVSDDGLIDSNGDEIGFDYLDEDYSIWADLGAAQKLWCEVRSYDPIQWPESER